MSEKKLILSKAKHLRTSTNAVYSAVYIRPDLTKKQLEASKNLRAQLQVKRTATPDKIWTIKQGQIVEVKTE